MGSRSNPLREPEQRLQEQEAEAARAGAQLDDVERLRGLPAVARLLPQKAEHHLRHAAGQRRVAGDVVRDGGRAPRLDARAIEIPALRSPEQGCRQGSIALQDDRPGGLARIHHRRFPLLLYALPSRLFAATSWVMAEAAKMDDIAVPFCSPSSRTILSISSLTW
ncbi:MAG: hypothetical protein QM820_36815 [Minicystis sp.]